MPKIQGAICPSLLFELRQRQLKGSSATVALGPSRPRKQLRWLGYGQRLGVVGALMCRRTPLEGVYNDGLTV